MERLVQAMTSAPKNLLGLHYGELKAGLDADVTLIDLDQEFHIDSNKFASLGKNTPFDVERVQGKIHTVFFQGKRVVSNGLILKSLEESVS